MCITYCTAVCQKYYMYVYTDVHVQATPTKMAWSLTNDSDNDGDYNHGGHGASHSEGNQTLATPSSDAVDSNYHRQDGRRNGQYLAMG